MNRSTIKTNFALRAMTRKARIILLTVAMTVALIAASSVAFAGEVSYEGQAGGFVFKPGSSQSATDLFTNFRDVVPGDTLTDTVDVANNSGKTAKLYMRAMGAYEGSDFLSQMTLKVDQRGGGKLFDASADKMGGLEEWVLLGTMSPGAKATLDLQLTVPIEMGNDYQDALGKVAWEFKVEEIDPDTPADGDGGDDGDGGGNKTATGDKVMLGVALAVLIAAAIAAITVLRRRRSQ